MEQPAEQLAEAGCKQNGLRPAVSNCDLKSVLCEREPCRDLCISRMTLKTTSEEKNPGGQRVYKERGAIVNEDSPGINVI